MADFTVVNPLVYGTPSSGVAPTANVSNVAGDRFAATPGRRYLMRINNGGGSSITVTVDDPNSTGVTGAKSAQNPDVDIPVVNATQKAFLVEADRFRDSNGWVNLAYSGTPTSMTIEVYGPL